MSSGGKPKRGHEEEHEEHGHSEAWAIPYADMLTLLMALFVVLFAVSKSDTEKFQEVAEAFHREFRGSGGALAPMGGGGAGILDGGPGGNAAGLDGPPIIIPWAEVNGASGVSGADGTDSDEPVPPLDESPAPVIVFEPSDEAIELAMRREAYLIAEDAYQELVELRELFETQAAAAGFGGSIDFRVESRGLVVSIVSDNVLFSAASADLPSEGARLLDTVAQVLGAVPNRIAIEGHSDSRPISTARFPSNWELSGARAATVLRYLVEQHDFEPERLTATGYADTRPVASEETSTGRALNRRVEIVVMSSASLAPLFEQTSASSS